MHRATLGGLFAFAVALGTVHAQSPDPRVEWLAKHTLRLRSTDPADEDYRDLEPLGRLIGEARLVQLGEQSHGDGVAFLTKTRLIKFLHARLGFDVLAFESGLFDCRKAWELLKEGRAPFEAVRHGVFAIWTRSEQLRPLIDYLGAAAKSDRPLELAGFDCQFTAAGSSRYLVSDLGKLVRRFEPPLVDDATWGIIEKGVGGLMARSGKAPPGDERKRLLAALKALGQALEARGERSDRESVYWRQLLKSIAAYAGYTWANAGGGPDRTLAERFNPRDAQMGENLLWLVRDRYPDRKIIVWAATMHVLRNASTIDTRSPGFSYRGVEPMGHHVWKALGEQVYTLGFTAYEGQAGLPWRGPWKIPAAADGSLEALCVAAGLENAIIDFRGLPEQHWIREPLVSRPLGHAPMRADWTRVVDGMVFNRTMTPSTQRRRDYNPEEKARAADLIASLGRTWKVARARVESGDAFADKGNFARDYEQWCEVATRSASEVATMEKKVAEWFASRKESDPGLEWRVDHLLALMAEGRGDRKLARQCIERAMTHYPDRTFPRPPVHSFFQHLVNLAALMVWDADGYEAAVRYAAEKLVADRRYHYFHPYPWDQRLRTQGRSGEREFMVKAITKAYACRAEVYPALAEATRRYADELRRSK